MSDRKDCGLVQYEIDHIRDLLNIPADKIDAVLADLKEWHTMGMAIKPLIDAGLVQQDGFTWVDDGRQGISDVIINGESLADALLSQRADKEVTHDH